jgi:hypothetical protein
MIDSDNVLLLRPAHSTSGFSFNNGSRPPRGSRATPEGFVAATIYYFDKPATSDFITYFESKIQPELIETGASVMAHFITEDSPNTFPGLPVREGEHVFVWFAGFQSQESYRSHLAQLRESKLWNGEIANFLKRRLQGKPEVLRLSPTPRSWLTGRIFHKAPI